MLAHALGRTRVGLYARLSDPVDPPIAARFEAFWRRRCQGEPYAYLVGEREFYGRMYAVAPGVLIPRADTETLLDAALARWPLTQHGTVVDAGTGSGALAVSFQLERPSASVYAVDRSAESLRIAQANARRLRAPVRFWCGDWLGALADGKFVYTECDIKADKLPKPVSAAITKLLPGGEIIEVEVAILDAN